MLPPAITHNLRHPLSAKDWEEHRATIQRLWSQENKKLREVMAILENDCGFRATAKQYKTQIKRWGLEKNVKDNEMRAVIRMQRKRKEIDGKESEFLLRDRVVPPQKIRRYMKRTGLSANA
ncbi:uncharacterized protein K441DRAFT_543101, partial [Cenococcum geophilum 1.58]|uniref:uncharacterized protein n=1 Tax=Cenococcum geophilum 1.58 TaxID=794803 RepID=UPI00358E66C5